VKERVEPRYTAVGLSLNGSIGLCVSVYDKDRDCFDLIVLLGFDNCEMLSWRRSRRVIILSAKVLRSS
jgi:hypothetical protein